MAIKSYELPKVDILNGGGVTNFLVNRGMETAQLPASLLPQILTADKLLMPDGVTSINRRLQQIGSGNLIDNADFSINQRGVTSWTSGYGLDRYTCFSATAYVVDQGIRLVSGEKAYSSIQQAIGCPAKNGDVFTLSALVKGGSGFRLVIGRSTNSAIATKDIPASDDWQLASLTTTLSNLSQLCVKVEHLAAVAGDEIIIHRWKLEPGPFQTLAHMEGNTWVLNDPPPNYALELLKCQRYFVRMKNTESSAVSIGFGSKTAHNKVAITVPLAVPMRIKPTVKCSDPSLLRVVGSTGEQYDVTSFYGEVLSANQLRISVTGNFSDMPYGLCVLCINSNGCIDIDANL